MKRLVLLSVSVLVLAGCDLLPKDDGTPTGPTPIPANVANYIALGASDVTGFGSAVPCGPFVTICPGATGYVYLIDQRLRQAGNTGRFEVVGFPGVVLGPSTQILGNQLDLGIVGNVLDGQLRFVKEDTTLATIFIGGNDVNVVGRALRAGFGGSQTNQYIANQVATFGADYRALVNGIKSQAPQARIVAINLPNMAALPYSAGLTLAEKRTFQQISVGFSAQINALTSLGAVVVDIMCDAPLYQPSMYSSDGFHPNTAGYARLADLTYAAATGAVAAPRASCSQMTLF